MKHRKLLARLMKMSWEIQRKRNSSRSKALAAAWVILTNEDVTVYYLVTKLNHHKPIKQKALNQMALFPSNN